MISFLFIFYVYGSLGQQTNTQPDKASYLKKSKSQRTTAIILSGTGATAFFIGGAISLSNISHIFDPNNNKDNSNLAAAFTYSGLGLMAISVPFYFSSAKKKRMAMKMSFHNERYPLLQRNNLVYKAMPSVFVKISL